MEKIKVAVGVDAQGAITKTHFGECEAIVFAEVFAEGHQLTGRTPNPLRQDEAAGHGDLEKLQAARRLLNEVDMLVAGKMSPNFRKLRLQDGKMPVISAGSVEPLLDYLSTHLPEILSYFADPGKIAFEVRT